MTQSCLVALLPAVAVGRLCSALVSITALPAVGRPRLVIIQDITAVYSPVVDSAFEVSLALRRTTTWRWRLAERHKHVPKGLRGT